MPPLPEKFLKGHMAKLAEDLIKEFNPEEFGFSREDLEECEKNPAKSFEILMNISTKNPSLIQNALKKIGKRLQEKIQSGQIKPQELAAEAEGFDIIGCVHSHTHTDPYPSPTDVAQAPDPDWHYIIVSLKRGAPESRAYRIVGEQISEETIVPL
jgi:proteasome lid subunit RPN8/RPN11